MSWRPAAPSPAPTANTPTQPSPGRRFTDVPTAGSVFGPSLHIRGSITGTDTVETLRSSSLGNCKQIPLEHSAYNEVILHLDCYEPDESNEYLSQAVMQLAGADGVRRATVLFVKAGSQ